MAQIYHIEPLTISVLVCLDSQRIYWKLQGDKMTCYEFFMSKANFCISCVRNTKDEQLRAAALNQYNYWKNKALALTASEARKHI